MAAARSQLTTLYSLPRLGLRDHEERRQAARHGLGNAHDVMAAGAGIARCAKIVVGTRTTKVQFGEFGAIGVPLEHHHLRPIVPDRRGQHRVLAYPDIAMVLCATGDRQPVLGDAAVLAAVGVGEIDRALIVGGLMHRKPAGVRMVSAKIAAGRCLEGKGQRRAGRAVIENRRENTGLQAAGDGSRIGGVDQTLREEVGNDLVLDGVGDVSAMPDARVRIEKRIQRGRPQRRLVNLPGILFQELNG